MPGTGLVADNRWVDAVALLSSYRPRGEAELRATEKVRAQGASGGLFAHG
jgi:hypothetical protein